MMDKKGESGMKKNISLLLLVVVLATPAFAYNPLETRSEARERHRSEEYQTRQNNPYGGEPIGGYSDRIGDSRGSVNEREKSDSLNSYGSNKKKMYRQFE